MVRVVVQVMAVILSGCCINASGQRFIIDDEEYLSAITNASAKLLHQGKLKSLESLRSQVQTKGAPVQLAPLSTQKLSPPDLYERLRESTLAVGTFYLCPDCGQWHFNSSAGFVVGEGGIVCTCCHVVTVEDEGVKKAYAVAADSTGHVFPVQSVIAADTESDTCFLKIAASGLKPLALRPDVRPGERVYCLSHPGGFHFMFSEGIVARLNRKRNEVYDEHGQTNGLMTRPILFLNVTAEFAPGSSGGPMVDEQANVVAQVASITDAGEPEPGTNENAPASPSVPVRFCTATEEVLRLTDPGFEQRAAANAPRLRPASSEVGRHKSHAVPPP